MRAGRFAVLLLGLCLCSVYVLFCIRYMPQFSDWDQAAYLDNIRGGIRRGFFVFNPHHLHFEVGGVLFDNFVRKHAGAAGLTDLAFNLRLRSVAAAAAGILFTLLFLHEATGRLGWAVLGATLVGLCHGYVHYARVLDTGIFPAAIQPVFLWFLCRLERAQRGLLPLSIAAGVVLFLGVMFHQYMAISAAFLCLCVALPAWVFRPPPLSPIRITTVRPVPALDRPRIRWAAFGIIAATGAISVGSAYYLAGHVYYRLPFDQPNPDVARGIWREATFQEWLFAYATAGTWGHGLEKFEPWRPARGLTDAFVTQTTPYKYSLSKSFAYDFSRPQAAAAVPNTLAVFIFLTVGLSVLLCPLLIRRYGRVLAFLLLSLAGHGLLSAYWEPHYFEFWLVPCQILCILAALILNLVGERLRVQLPAQAAYLVFVLALGSYNFVHYIKPRSETVHVEGYGAMKTQSWDPLAVMGPAVYRVTPTWTPPPDLAPEAMPEAAPEAAPVADAAPQAASAEVYPAATSATPQAP